jgi:transposase InsO family protein
MTYLPSSFLSAATAARLIWSLPSSTSGRFEFVRAKLASYPGVTTSRAADYRPAPDQVERDSTTSGSNRLWAADITYVPMRAGFLSLAVALDAWSRHVAGLAMANHLRDDLVLDAFNMAVQQRLPNDVIHHSNHGFQYTSIDFEKRGQELGVRRSTGIGRRLLRQSPLRELLSLPGVRTHRPVHFPYQANNPPHPCQRRHDVFLPRRPRFRSGGVVSLFFDHGGRR